MENLSDIHAFRSTRIFGYIVIAGFVLVALAASFISFGSVVALAFPDFGFETQDGDFMSVGLMLASISALFDMPARLGLIVFFLIWIYKAYKNLTPLRAYHQEFSPGWAVGWWFIPFLNLVRPYQVVREVYNESDPEYEEDMGFLSVTGQGAPLFVSIWWLTFLAGGIAYRLSDVLYGAGDLPASNAVFIPLVLGGLLWATSASLGAYIVYEIVNRQDARFLRILSSVDRTPAS